MNSVKLMHSEMRGIEPTTVMLFWIWDELSGTEIAEMSQIYLNVIEFQKIDKRVFLGMKTRWKTFKIGIHSYSNKATGVTSGFLSTLLL